MITTPEMQTSIDYTNWRGQRYIRRITPIKVWFGSTHWHPQRQWLMTAFDDENNDVRDFAMRDIHGGFGAHSLYKTSDSDKPDSILDRNGEVTLGLCRICGQGEADLEPTCPGKRHEHD